MSINQRLIIAYLNFFGITGLSIVLAVAYSLQFLVHEPPCPLCLLQRACLLGVSFGLLLNLRYGFKPCHYGMSIFSAMLGAAIAGKQMLLWICPRPTGLVGYGDPFLGLHLYSWALIFFSASIFITAMLLMFSGQFSGEEKNKAVTFKMKGVSDFSFWLLSILFISNFVVTVVSRYF